MQGVYLIFDYFKEAFRINRKNKMLYTPQIALIIIKLLMIIGVGTLAYLWVGGDQWHRFASHAVRPADLLPVLLTFGGGIIGISLTYIVATRIIEAGLYNMYKQCVVAGVVGSEDFWQGVNRYFVKFLLIDLLVILGWCFFAVFYVLIGIMTLSIGFAVVPMIIGIFLTMWKISLVMNDSGLFAALGDSLKFAKSNFIPLSVLQFVHWSFVGRFSNIGGGSGRNLFQWRGDGNAADMPRFDGWMRPNQDEIFETVVKVIRLGIVILVPVITIATAVAALVEMVFEIFFSLALFVAYQNGFKEPGQLLEKEVLA